MADRLTCGSWRGGLYTGVGCGLELPWVDNEVWVSRNKGMSQCDKGSEV